MDELSKKLLAALVKCEAVLSQMQEGMHDAATVQSIMRMGYTGNAIVDARAAIREASKK